MLNTTLVFISKREAVFRIWEQGWDWYSISIVNCGWAARHARWPIHYSSLKVLEHMSRIKPKIISAFSSTDGAVSGCIVCIKTIPIPVDIFIWGWCQQLVFHGCIVCKRLSNSRWHFHLRMVSTTCFLWLYCLLNYIPIPVDIFI